MLCRPCDPSYHHEGTAGSSLSPITHFNTPQRHEGTQKRQVVAGVYNSRHHHHHHHQHNNTSNRKQEKHEGPKPKPRSRLRPRPTPDRNTPRQTDRQGQNGDEREGAIRRTRVASRTSSEERHHYHDTAS
ncbi:hypothetical protein E2C01_047745 [Portunus trituberculatus]|uniref:Uncharacterized protein n=1 Tax=Portunus trituberculatus TaxID=210409 RepID=A0A5B7G9C7_PORTR|nr:hypothetical protein [Portunus trituberculatus]